MQKEDLMILLMKINEEMAQDETISSNVEIDVENILLREHIKRLIHLALTDLKCLPEDMNEVEEASYIYQSIIKPLFR